MKWLGKKSLADNSATLPYIFILLSIIIVFFMLVFTIIKQQVDIYTDKTIKTHNFYLVGNSIISHIEDDAEHASQLLLENNNKSTIQHDENIINNLFFELRKENKRVQKLHQKYDDARFSALMQKLDKAINLKSTNINVDSQYDKASLERQLNSIYTAAHQIGRLYTRKLEILGEEKITYIGIINTPQRILIVLLILFAITLSTLIILAIRRINAELQTYQVKLETLVEERTEQLEAAQKELVKSERLSVLGQLTATVSHELRNPLGAIRPSLYVIRKKIPENDEKLLRALDRVDRNVQRCDHIIDELLDFTRIKDLNLTRINLHQWLKHLLIEQNINNDIAIIFNFDKNDIIIIADQDRLRRAMINVIENACQAMTEPYEKDIIIQGSRLSISTQTNGQHVFINVADNGCGIAEDILPHVFEPLFSTQGFGVGLGMPTVKQIMAQHNGGISIDTAVNQGTNITLWLPNNNNTEPSS